MDRPIFLAMQAIVFSTSAEDDDYESSVEALRDIEKPARKPNGRAYAALLGAAELAGWPSSFLRDLTVYDRDFLAKLPEGAPFAWVLRETGTHIVAANGQRIDGAGHRASQYPRMVADAFGAPRCRWFFWNGSALEELASAGELATRICETENAARAA